MRRGWSARRVGSGLHALPDIKRRIAWECIDRGRPCAACQAPIQDGDLFTKHASGVWQCRRCWPFTLLRTKALPPRITAH